MSSLSLVPDHRISKAPAVFEMAGIAKSYDNGRILALQNVSLTIHEGDFAAILGPSGCGKTTLLHVIGTLEQPSEGTLTYRGRSIDATFDKVSYRAHEVGLIFQEFHLLPTLTAIENVQIPMLEMTWSASERFRRARDLLDSVGLEARRNQLPSQLSGGERQRVAIARSLANRPSVLLADEPTGNLDSASTSDIMDLLKQIHRDQNISILMVTHDTSVGRNATREIRMRDGRIASDSITTDTAQTIQEGSPLG